jgi:hypothetical protein
MEIHLPRKKPREGEMQWIWKHETAQGWLCSDPWVTLESVFILLITSLPMYKIWITDLFYLFHSYS